MLAGRQLRVRLGERPLARLAPIAALAPPQHRRTTRQRKITHAHHRAVLDRHRRAPAPATTRRTSDRLDLQLERVTDVHDPEHDHPLDPEKTATVIQHPLLLLTPRSQPPRSLRRAADVLPSAPQPRHFSKSPFSPARADQFSRGLDTRCRTLRPALTHRGPPRAVCRPGEPAGWKRTRSSWRRCLVSPGVADHAGRRVRRLGDGQRGISTLLMTWITPLDAATSGVITRAPPTSTLPSRTRTPTRWPLSVLIELRLTTFAAVSLPWATW